MTSELRRDHPRVARFLGMETGEMDVVVETPSQVVEVAQPSRPVAKPPVRRVVTPAKEMPKGKSTQAKQAASKPKIGAKGLEKDGKPVSGRPASAGKPEQAL